MPGRALLSHGDGVEDARLEVVGRLHEREHAHLPGGAQAGPYAGAPTAGLDVALERRVRQLVELIVERVDDVLVELVAIHDPLTVS